MRINRRTFSSRAGMAALGLTLPRSVFGSRSSEAPVEADPGYGPLRRDPAGLLELPRGFQYRVISKMGTEMSDGFYVPGFPDGMAAFPGPDGVTLVLRNHEFRIGAPRSTGPFKGKRKLLNRIDPGRIYDSGGQHGPCLGSVTTLVYDTRAGKLEAEFLSLVGTLTNCSGGVTPQGTWVSCEESCEGLVDGFSRDHGFVFEVPAAATPEIHEPIPVRALGRFAHEAIVFDSRTGISYQTEDRPDGLFYRFVPDRRDLPLGEGRLQALSVIDRPRMDTRNWSGPSAAVGTRMPVRWIDLDEVDGPMDDLRRRGYLRGAALFARGEGICWFGKAVCFSCTTGGADGRGQIWRYSPSPEEGTEGESLAPGQLELFLESGVDRELNNPDQFCPAPWGDLFYCEDGTRRNHIVGVTPPGRAYYFARNVREGYELAGACFSPDGTTLFVNNLQAGLTFAITGPWFHL